MIQKRKETTVFFRRENSSLMAIFWAGHRPACVVCMGRFGKRSREKPLSSRPTLLASLLGGRPARRRRRSKPAILPLTTAPPLPRRFTLTLGAEQGSRTAPAASRRAGPNDAPPDKARIAPPAAGAGARTHRVSPGTNLATTSVSVRGSSNRGDLR